MRVAGLSEDEENEGMVRPGDVLAAKLNGDWCSSANKGAEGLCYDAVSVDAGFAASAFELK